MISGKSKVCGVMGCPIGHSLSPFMQNLYSERSGTDMAYVPLKVEPDGLEAAVKGAYALGFTGMNVTIPYKKEVMRYLWAIDDGAKAIGAVNTLVRMGDGFKGYNTDASGLKRAMLKARITIRDRTCVLLGAGGAAMAAAFVLAEEGAAAVYVLNRSAHRGRTLSQAINDRFGRRILIPTELTACDDLKGEDLLAIQTTSVGMHPDVDLAPIESATFYRRIKTAVDIVYNPKETKFMGCVKEAGGRVLGGLDMLLYQGVTAFELWNPGVILSPQVIEEARGRLEEKLEEKPEEKPEETSWEA